MTEETNDGAATDGAEGNGQPPPNGGGEGDKPKRVVKRKALWLCVPKEYGEIVNDNGDIDRSPITYELYECATKGEIEKVLQKLKLDITNVKLEHVKIFRADPIPLRLSTQVTIKF
jgi:hypothetical protein